MRLLSSVFPPASTLRGAFCLAFAISLIGCATKNPQIDQSAASKPAQTTDQASAGGVQTSKERRLFGIFSPYRLDVQQGNFISREMVAQIKPGMTPDQVRFVLGTPLLTDIFHADRWDYVFRFEKGNGNVLRSHVAVHFKDNRVARVDGGDLPSEQDYLALIAGRAPLPQAAAPTPAAPAAVAPAAK